MGKSSILMVMGFNVIFALMGFSLSRVASEGLKNYAIYYTTSQAHNIAQAAANIACNQIFFAPYWQTGYSNVPFGGGSFSVVVKKTTNLRILVTATATMRGPDDNTSLYEDKIYKIKIIMQPSSFSKFAYYSVVENNVWWVSKDTVWGPLHTQDQLQLDGKPVFWGKVTAQRGLFKKNVTTKAEFHGGYQGGVSITMPANMDPLTAAAEEGGRRVQGMNLSLTFNVGGTVTYKEGTAAAQTVPVSTYAPNGVIVVTGGDLRIKGTVSGHLTVASIRENGNNGNVWLDDDVKYATDPSDPNCNDMLGIVATQDIWVTDNAANNSNITIHASMFCEKGGFKAEGYNTRPIAGAINLVGGIQNNARGPVGTFNPNTGVIGHGFYKNYKYDNRLMTDSPPMYPTTGSYEIVSWYESRVRPGEEDSF